MEETKVKKILIVVDTNVGGKGGAETHLWNLLSGIERHGLSADVIYFDADEMDIKNARKHITGVNYFRVPVRKVYSLSSVKYFKEIYSIMKSGQYDCVMSFFESSDIVVASLGSLAGIPMRISNRRDTGFRNSNKLEKVYRFINRFFTGFIGVSEAVKDSIIEQGVKAEKIHVVYNAVDCQRFESTDSSVVREALEIKADELVFGMVANLNPVKNHQAVIEALSFIHKEDKKAHLVLTGEGVLRTELEEQVKKLNLTKYVHFLGTRDDVAVILQAYDVFILASHTEGLSNALLEAMASKKPVIASRVGGNVEVIEDGVDGILVSTESDSIAKAMMKLADSESLRSAMGESGYRHILREFSLEQMLIRYKEIIDPRASLTKLEPQVRAKRS